MTILVRIKDIIYVTSPEDLEIVKIKNLNSFKSVFRAFEKGDKLTLIKLIPDATTKK
jgi:hypothetical protein